MDTLQLKSELVSGFSKQMIEYLLQDLRDMAKEKQELADEIDRLKVQIYELETKLKVYRLDTVTIYQEPQRSSDE